MTHALICLLAIHFSFSELEPAKDTLSSLAGFSLASTSASLSPAPSPMSIVEDMDVSIPLLSIIISFGTLLFLCDPHGGCKCNFVINSTQSHSIVLVDLNEFPSIFQKVQHSHTRYQKATSNLLRINLKNILKFNEIWPLEGAMYITLW